MSPKEMGLPDDWEQHPGDFNVESQCGPNDESQPVEQYDGTLGVTQAFVSKRQAAVGQLQWNDDLATKYDNPGTLSGLRWCTGTLISCDLFLTAGHCFDQAGGGSHPLVNGTMNVISSAEIATNMHVNFNYQVDSNGVMRQEQSFAVEELVEYRLGELDYAIVRLAGNPGKTFGWTPISTTDAEEGDILCIIQHPAGLPKRIEAGPAFHLHGDRIGYDSIDTQPGSSGSGILRSPDGQIVGVHTNGGCNPTQTGHNHGVRISSIRPVSGVISNISTYIALCDPKVTIPGVPSRKLTLRDDIALTFSDIGPVKLRWPGDFTLPYIDQPFPGGIRTRPDIDPIKTVFLDKQGTDFGGITRYLGDPTLSTGPTLTKSISNATPFVLATPHHTMAWTDLYSGAAVGGVTRGQVGNAQAQYEAALGQMAQHLQVAAAELRSMEEQYRALEEEYRQVMAQG